MKAKKKEGAAPKKYRMLRKGEGIRESDEVWAAGEGPWEPAGHTGLFEGAEDFLTVLFDPEIMNPFRCLVSPKGSAKRLPRSRTKTRSRKVTPKRPHGKQ